MHWMTLDTFAPVAAHSKVGRFANHLLEGKGGQGPPLNFVESLGFFTYFNYTQ